MFNWILIFTLSAGQLFKFPSSGSGATMLDLSLIILSVFGFLKLKSFHRPSKIFLSGIIFIVICIISLVFTPLHLSQQEYLQSFVYTLRFGLYLFVAFLISSEVFKINLEKIILGSSLIISILGIAQLIFLPDLKDLAVFGWDPHFFRTVSTFLDPNFLGAYLVLSFLLLLSLRGDKNDEAISQYRLPQPLRVFAMTIIYLALMTTFSRSSYLMFLFSGITLSFVKKSIKLFITTLLLFAVLLIGFQIYTILVSKPRNIDRGYSANARLNTWQQGVNIFNHSPILGVGFNAYRYSLREYKLAGNDFTNTRGASSNDASLLNILATTGIIGFLSFIYFIFLILTLCLKNKSVGLVGFAFIVGLLVHSFFNNSLFYPQILFLIVLIAALVSPSKNSNA